MSVLLASDQIELYPAGELDSHGWREEPGPGTRAAWTGLGSLQLITGESDARAADAGGHGPYDPARVVDGNLFLPVGAEPVEGMTARIRGELYVLAHVRLVTDPVSDSLTCWAATVRAPHHG
jgi:hypothetical protein